MSNNQREARNTTDQRTTNAINNLINKTSTKFDFIKLAMDRLPTDKKYDVDALLAKTRSQVEQITKNRVGDSGAKTNANALTVRHIVEYIIHNNNNIRTMHNNTRKLDKTHRKKAETPQGWTDRQSSTPP